MVPPVGFGEMVRVYSAVEEFAKAVDWLPESQSKDNKPAVGTRVKSTLFRMAKPPLNGIKLF
jgi:hypothetical protein